MKKGDKQGLETLWNGGKDEEGKCSGETGKYRDCCG